MSEVIQIRDLSKQYRLGVVNVKTLSDDIKRWWAQFRGKENPFLKVGEVNNRAEKGISEYVWALRDINFSVSQGEVVGVIGKNGAGKSTLLKILSRITSPTTGNIRIKGRVASLLEVGTGFHPELTGRENIFLNGAILGMTKQEISSKFDAIVDFSGTERYIDTPVKRYSSGMYVRLAFAVAAHLEPEILIVDEVLAVGDAEFQKKCIGKMKSVSGEGRTVIFVSHNMGSIQQLCKRSILLNQGSIQLDGNTGECIEEYKKVMNLDINENLLERSDNKGTGDARFKSIKIIDSSTGKVGSIESGNDVTIEMKVVLNNPEILNEKVVFRFTVIDEKQYNVAHGTNLISGEDLILDEGVTTLRCQIKKLPLNVGNYSISAFVGSKNIEYDYFARGAGFQVVPGNFYPTAKLPDAGHSYVLLDYKWFKDN